MKDKKELIRKIKFTLFSISAGIIEIVIFTLLEEFTNFSYWACYLPALIASVIWNFTLNREYTFKSTVNIPKAMTLVFLFYLHQFVNLFLIVVTHAYIRTTYCILNIWL